MPTLAEMLAAKKAATQAPQSPAQIQSPQPSEASSNGNATSGDSSIANSGGENAVTTTAPAGGTESIQVQPTSASTPAPANGLGGLRLGGLKLGSLNLGVGSAIGNTGGGDASVAETNQPTEPRPAGDDKPADGIVSSSDSEEPTKSLGLGLAAIAGLGAGVPEPTQLIAEEDLNDGVDSLDLVDCVAPDRELPADLTDQMKSFIKSLDSIFQLAADPEMFVDMVRKTQREMQEHPALGKLLCDADVRIAIRGMRQSAGLAQVKKVAAKEKRGKSAKANSAAVSSAMDSLLSLASSTAFD